MWDIGHAISTTLTHDMPCPRCGHAPHSYLPCSDECECVPVWADNRRHALEAA